MEEEKGKSGEESRSQTTEKSLSFEDYLADTNLVVFTAQTVSTLRDIVYSWDLCSAREGRRETNKNSLTFHLLSDLFHITRDT